MEIININSWDDFSQEIKNLEIDMRTFTIPQNFFLGELEIAIGI
ncbi:hypothetical protein BMS3Abin05_00168 [bacterium BMS3Abin05]|nr:hypothetical protein BMS3Abin05_00168 [bacterium BMS3Abin05]